MAARVEGVRQTDPSMRRLLAPFVVLAGLGAVVLYVFPEDTDRLFSWTLRPPLSAMFMGAGFAAGVALSILSYRKQPWAVTRIATVTIFVFVLFMTVTTFMNLDQMHFDSEYFTARLAAWLWLAVYVFVPPAMAVLIVLQERKPGSDPPRLAPMPLMLRAALLAQGLVMLAIGLALFISPDSLEHLWPWQISALSGRALAAWIIAIGFAAVWATAEDDLQRARPAAITSTLLGVLWLVGAIRGSADMRWEQVSAWVYVAAVVAATLVGVWGWVLANRSRPPADA